MAGGRRVSREERLVPTRHHLATPNLTRLPQPASSELVAPLYAYLGTHAADTKHTLPATPRPGSTSAADPLPGRVDRLRAAGARRRRDLAGHGGADPGARSADRAPPQPRTGPPMSRCIPGSSGGVRHESEGAAGGVGARPAS